MSTGERVLVVGSYPPIPLPAAAATMAVVQRAWVDGDEVTVVSPRLSAAHLAVPVVGVLAGRRLGNLHRHTATSRLVMVLEPGLPVPALPPGGSAPAPSLQPGWLLARLRQWLTVEAIRPALATFDHVTLVRVGDLGLSAWVERRLLGAATEVVEAPPSPASTFPEAMGVTILGPVEVPPRERPQQIAGVLARRVLGPYAGPVRVRVGAVLRSVRSLRPPRR